MKRETIIGFFLVLFMTVGTVSAQQQPQQPSQQQSMGQRPDASAAAAPQAATAAAGVMKSSSVDPASLMPAAAPPSPKGASPDAKGEEKPASYRGPVTTTGRPIVVEAPQTPLTERLERTITLDVREMNVLDVIKFLALKGDFNMITGNQVTGRVTLFLKNVKIIDALDIIVVSNNLAYYIEDDIVYVLSAQEYLATFGRRFNDKNQVEIVQLKYAKPAYAMAALESVKSQLGKIIIDEDTGSLVLIDTPEALEKMRRVLAEIENPLEPLTFTLQYARADVVAERLHSRLEAHSVGTVTVDERSNKLIVRALPQRRNEIEAMIREMDAPTKEVLIEVRVLQVTFNPKMDYGIDWEMAPKGTSNSFLNKFNLKTSMLTGLTNVTTNYGKIAYGDIDVDDFEGSIRALKQVSNTRILSNPRLLVTNKEEAMIHVGDTVPYIISTTSGTGDNAITSEDVRFVDVGVKINVTPTINDDGFVTMRLRPEISSVASTVSSQGGGIPQVNKTLLESTIMVKDGMTIILGGLKKENKVQIVKGIPVLMDIPYLRPLFSSKSDSIEATEIVIFITPHILSGADDFRKYKGEIKPDSKYSEKISGWGDSQFSVDGPEKKTAKAKVLRIKE